VAGLAHDQEREVLPCGLTKPVDELLGRHFQLELSTAFPVGLLLQPIAWDCRQRGRLAMGEAKGYREVGVAIVVEGYNPLTTFGQDTRERAGYGRLAGAAFSPDRDLHGIDRE
jgi:hypothetical protein